MAKLTGATMLICKNLRFLAILISLTETPKTKQ